MGSEKKGRGRIGTWWSGGSHTKQPTTPEEEREIHPVKKKKKKTNAQKKKRKKGTFLYRGMFTEIKEKERARIPTVAKNVKPW